MATLPYDPKQNDPRFVEPQDQPKTPLIEGQPDTEAPAPPTAPVANAPLPAPPDRPPPASAPIGTPPPPISPPKAPAKPPPEPTTGRPPPKPPQRYDPPPVRKMERWGDDYWAMQELQNNPNLVNSRFLPTEREAPGVLGGANRQLAAFSAPAIAGPAGIIAGLASIVGPFFDLMSNNAFSQHYRAAALGGQQMQMNQLKMQETQMKMREDEMKFKREQMIDMAEDLQITHSQMLSDYKSVFDDLKSGAITEDEAKQQIAELNQQWHHGNLDSVMHDNGLQGVANALDVEHQKFVHSWAATATLRSSDKTRAQEEKEQEKAQKLADLEAPYRKQGTGAAAPGGTSQSVIGYTAPGQPDVSRETTPGQPPTAAAGTAPTTAAPEGGDEDDPQGLKQSSALNQADAAGFDRDEINSVAEDMLFGEFKGNDPRFKGNDKVVGFATQRENEMRKQINAIKRDPNLKTKEQVYDALDKVSPRLKGQVEAVVGGAQTIPSRSGVGGKQPWPMITDLARKAEPRLDTLLVTRPGTLRYYTSGLGARQYAQLGTAYDHGKSLIRDMQDLPPLALQFMFEHANSPDRMALLSRAFPEAAKKIARIEKDVDVFASETGAVLAYGQGTGREREELKKGFNWLSPATTIAAAQTQLDKLRDRESNLQHDFAQGTGLGYDDWRGRFKDIDPKILSDNPNAEYGLDEIEKDRAGDHKVHDYREYFGVQ